MLFSLENSLFVLSMFEVATSIFCWYLFVMWFAKLLNLFICFIMLYWFLNNALMFFSYLWASFALGFPDMNFIADPTTLTKPRLLRFLTFNLLIFSSIFKQFVWKMVSNGFMLRLLKLILLSNINLSVSNFLYSISILLILI